MRERGSSPSRRGLLKGTVAATAAASLANLAVADQADAELLTMGSELEALWVEEQEFSAQAERLNKVGERLRPEPSAALLAYDNEGEPLFHFRAGAYRPNPPVLAHVQDCERAWRVTGFREGPCPEAALLVDLEAWNSGGARAHEACGAAAAERELERAAAACCVLVKRIVHMPARTAAGLAVKLRALTIARTDGPEDDYIGEVITSPEDYTTDQRMAFSVLRDALAILGVGATQ
ncbi:hypothetical protein ABLE93_15655 [Xanthobacter sp. KR7-65]|uniref:hypothetical protein n=1 Tax=Xanthobacter sp. KR7-65 TaxID=3156612 RepID=UPI0032B62A38